MVTNHLAAERSPYLRQHATNPVHWFPWGNAAFQKAAKEHKPIFLSIGYSTCHWCHVMAHESFEDQATADILNQYFVAIKVDREERPDIDHIYMNAVMAIAGQGGWPLSVFLKPDGKPFYGGTYFPPAAKWGSPGFKDVLLSIHNAWTSDHEGILSSSDELISILRQSMTAETDAGPTDYSILDDAVQKLAAQYDTVHGGFSNAPKFPMGHTLSFLLSMDSKESPTLPMVEHTLTTMAKRGIHDHLASGFHRYATDQEWQVPHFEKMLYDQALLVIAYVQCYQKTQDRALIEIARRTMDYVLAEMKDPEGGFYCAYDADSKGQEGAYYVFADHEITAVLGESEAKLFKMYHGVSPDGNVAHDPHGEFISVNILYSAKDIVVADGERMDIARRKLLEYRRERMPLHLDDKILTDWNGLMIAALCVGGLALGEDAYIQQAQHCAEYILQNYLKDGVLLHASGINGMLDDYVYFSYGLIMLYEATSQEKYLKTAEDLVEECCRRFSDGRGGYYMTQEDSGLIVRPIEIYDGAMPSGNSMAAMVFAKLLFITGKKEYRDKLSLLETRFYPVLVKAPHGYTYFLLAMSMQRDGPVDVQVTGGVSAQQLVQIRKMVYKCYVPNLVLKIKPTDQPFKVSVCRKGVCGLPISDLKGLQGQLT